jgi:uncharacterized membrane protein YphA (DoxX/SURF4 family)
LILRAAVASVWLYQGLWSKLLAPAPRHQKIVGKVPFLNSRQARWAVMLLGSLECVLAVWVLSGFRARDAALLETLLLGFMNAGGLVWARNLIPDPVNMLLQNSVFLLLAWVAAGNGSYAA